MASDRIEELHLRAMLACKVLYPPWSRPLLVMEIEHDEGCPSHEEGSCTCETVNIVFTGVPTHDAVLAGAQAAQALDKAKGEG